MTHRERNQVTVIQVGVRETSMVRVLGAGGELANTDVGPAPGGGGGMAGYPMSGTKRDLRKCAVGLALATHGGVAQKDMIPALQSWREKETGHMLASLGNLGRNLDLGLDLVVRERRVMVVCPRVWRPVCMPLFSQ